MYMYSCMNFSSTGSTCRWFRRSNPFDIYIYNGPAFTSKVESELSQCLFFCRIFARNVLYWYCSYVCVYKDTTDNILSLSQRSPFSLCHSFLKNTVSHLVCCLLPAQWPQKSHLQVKKVVWLIFTLFFQGFFGFKETRPLFCRRKKAPWRNFLMKYYVIFHIRM